MDYVCIPFKCNRCHDYGHLVSHCHLSLKKNSRDENKTKYVWRVKKPVVTFVELSEVRTNFVRPMDEGLGFSSTGKDSPMNSCIQALKMLSLPFQGAKVSAGKSE